ncbi:type 1 glutamine amidotransferase domain-containing protein [Streptomyces sp. NRRL F-5630]|uniref:type 1 glutamine amidotransferase domain-containing protein n=1 Tax=Streptomyces sp. NRRL F-5630 TaxID=1463864 RepID=UPI0004C74239|nr:type 1 glutamine amidotransferase domain-containing protein [Streptomyces sp. NRRL F-5630]
MPTILFVLTGTDHWTLADGTRHPTGFWADEVVAPWSVFTEAGYEVEVATPGAVVPTVDAASLDPSVAGGPEGAARLREALDTMTPLLRPRPLAGIDPDAYAAVFYPGGHGPMEDLSHDPDSAALLTRALSSGRPLALVCHGPAALLATADAEGNSPFAGYRLTAFTNAEETQSGFASRAPWLLQDRLTALGADVLEGEAWAPKTVSDRTLHTGQNPASAGPLAEVVLRELG